MSGLVKQVASVVDSRCVVVEMEKEECQVSLDCAPTSRMIVDLDEPGSPLEHPNRRCDYLFFADDDGGGDGWVAPLELKRGRFRAGQCVRQLVAGTQAAEKLVPRDVTVRFRPIAVYGGVLHGAERRRFRDRYESITFRDSCERVRLLKCGSRLAEELK